MAVFLPPPFSPQQTHLSRTSCIELRRTGWNEQKCLLPSPSAATEWSPATVLPSRVRLIMRPGQVKEWVAPTGVPPPPTPPKTSLSHLRLLQCGCEILLGFWKNSERKVNCKRGEHPLIKGSCNKPGKKRFKLFRATLS